MVSKIKLWYRKMRGNSNKARIYELEKSIEHLQHICNKIREENNDLRVKVDEAVLQLDTATKDKKKERETQFDDWAKAR